MVEAGFIRKDGKFIEFAIKGHADYGDYGQDIVCASVTSAVQMTANAITEIISVDAEVTVEENEIKVSLPVDSTEMAFVFMDALYFHLVVFSEDYEGTIKVTITEV